jgi:hypothetical protein
MGITSSTLCPSPGRLTVDEWRIAKDDASNEGFIRLKHTLFTVF